ncbi:MAG: ROK family protein [Methylophilaceae bacterium]
MSNQSNYVAGVDIGGTNLRVGVVQGLQLVYEKRTHADFATLCKTHAPTIAWQKIIEITSHALKEAILAYPQITAVGIGFPGFIDPANGLVAQSPNLPGLRDVDLAQDLSSAIGLPVIVENDALAAAYGEFRLNKNEAESLIYLGLGTGVGGGLIHAGKPFSGQHGVAMEVGHIIIDPIEKNPQARLCGCGNYGCMEQYASASGVVVSYESASGKQASADAIANFAHAGDKHALQAYRLAGASLAQALAHILKVVDVPQVVIGGGMSQAWPLMQAAFEERLEADLIPVLRHKVSIKISDAGDQAGIIGAALLAEMSLA